MRRILSAFLATVILLVAAVVQAKTVEPKPIAAVTVASYDDLIGDINFVGELIDRPSLGTAADGMISLATQLKGLAGVDKSRPWGAIAQASGDDEIIGYVCVPITDFKEFLGLLGVYCTVQAEGGVHKLTPKDGKQIIYVKEQGKWAYFSDQAKTLTQIAADPLSVLGGADKNYLVAGRVFFANVPGKLRVKFLANIKDDVQGAANNKEPDETDEQFTQRKMFLQQAGAYVTQVAGDLDQINIGWALDRAAKKTYFDLGVIAKPGTETAADMALASAAKTYFSAFRPSNAASIWTLASPIPSPKQALANSLIELVRGRVIAEIEKQTPENKRATAKELAGDTFDLLVKIVKSGRIDGVMTALVDAKSATGLGALFVADGNLLDKIVHKIVKVIEEEHPDVSQFVKVDAEKLNDLIIHTISIPIPVGGANREIIVQFIGEKLDVVIAVGKENVYFAAGRDAASKLKKAIDESKQSGPKTVAPLDIFYAAKRIVGAAAASGDPQVDQVAKAAEAELAKAPGQDHVTLTVKAIPSGVQVRLEVESGLLRLAGHMFTTNVENSPPAKIDEPAK